ncbi:hypothetical protein BBROOKSOX_1478 [Bathymodiolus brooksi thiotrophic gill symbiont]|nr:hypothetical protein BBROOKSOX_1478 [Bathymodiolus brooksi thiotrophic gill symbiont]
MPAVSITRAVRVLPVPAIKVTASSMVAHVLLLPVVATQSAPSALTCSVSSLAKTRLLPKVKLTLTALSLVIRSLSNTPASLLIATVCIPTGASTIVVSMVTSEVSPEPFTVLPNKVPDNLTCMTYLALLFSPEVQSLSFANVQLPALSILIALIKALLTVCITLFVEKNLISEIDKPEALLRFVILPVMVAVDNSLVLI